MLSEELILNNKNRFISLVKSISRENCDIEGLLNKLENSDFFIAPASTKYHLSCKGGLCQHSLNVYDNLNNIMSLKYCAEEIEKVRDSLIIISLFHDLSKMNFYEEYSINKKNYHLNGSKFDNLGNFDWISEISYKVKDFKERYIYGTHGQNSERILSYFIPLKEEESVSILWHHADMDNNVDVNLLSTVYDRYPLAVSLHLADMLSTYIDERE